MLNTREDFTINLARKNAEPQRITVRWPSDSEWIAREEALIAPIRMDRGETEVLGANMDDVDAADLKLFRTIHKAGEFSEDQALMFVDILSAGFLVDKQEGDEWTTVRLDALGVNGVARMPTVHYMKEPTYRVARRWKAEARSTTTKGKIYKVRLNIRLAADMYNALLDHVDGYDGPVPIIHKSAVVQALFDRLAAKEAEDSEGASDLDPAGF